MVSWTWTWNWTWTEMFLVLVLVVPLVFQIKVVTPVSAVAVVGGGGDSAKPVEVNVIKCCPFKMYFNDSSRTCERYPSSWTSLGGSSSLMLLVRGGEGDVSWRWEAPSRFWRFYSNETPPAFLTFDAKSIGMPHCATGDEEDIKTQVFFLLDSHLEPGAGDEGEEAEPGPGPGAGLAQDSFKGNGTGANMTSWEHDVENEIHFFFVPNLAMLVEDRSDLTSQGTYHNREQFCVDLTETELIVRVCGCSDKQPCIRKCCPVGEHLTFNTDPNEAHLCSAYEIEGDSAPTKDVERWELPLHSKPGTPLTREERKELQPRYVANYVPCEYFLVSSGWSDSIADTHMTFVVDKNGQPHSYDPILEKWRVWKTSDFCFDRLEADPVERVCHGEQEVMLVCRDEEEEGSSRSEVMYYLFVVALGIATLLLFLTAVILSLLIERRNIHSWTRLAYVLSHFAFFFIIGLTHVHAVVPHVGADSCKVVAVLIHFMGLTTACWLSIINFDLWWTFKVLKPRRGDRLDVWRFVWYNCFALGLPLLIISTALGIQNNKPKFVCRSEVQIWRPVSPNYGADQSCSMSADARPFYWFGPLCVLLVANLIFFLTTTRRMMGLQRMTRRASIESTSGQTQSRQIFVKIFIVSGVTWWVEIIHWIFNKSDSEAWYWDLLDMMHFVQAVAIFVIFACKRDVLRSLQIKYPIITKIIPPVSKLERSGTHGSMSTDPHSRSFRVNNYKLNGRKMSTVSTTSSTGTSATDCDHTNYQRHESFELTPKFSSPPPTPTPTPTQQQQQQPHQSVKFDFSSLGLEEHEQETEQDHPDCKEPKESTYTTTSFIQGQGQGQGHGKGQGQTRDLSSNYFERRETVEPDKLGLKS